DIFDIVKDDIDDRKYAFFGHSMGSLLVYELVYKILENGLPMPIHLFLSGRYPPNVRDNGKIIHKLSDVNFKNAIREFGGTPEEVLENPELWDIFSPILRADYKILENYIYEPKPFKLYCDISILYGKSDKEVEQYDLSKWQDFTIGKCQVYKFDGGHFFIHEKMEKVISLIKSTLENYERD
ncbi:MAG TPA: thioesterase domain-containing protein, partial [Ruminiclostridium sp.]|nr:thioesterase domain-containing protein [Ruminiclostridium sp.]